MKEQFENHQRKTTKISSTTFTNTQQPASTPNARDWQTFANDAFYGPFGSAPFGGISGWDALPIDIAAQYTAPRVGKPVLPAVPDLAAKRPVLVPQASGLAVVRLTNRSGGGARFRASGRGELLAVSDVCREPGRPGEWIIERAFLWAVALGGGSPDYADGQPTEEQALGLAYYPVSVCVFGGDGRCIERLDVLRWRSAEGSEAAGFADTCSSDLEVRVDRERYPQALAIVRRMAQRQARRIAEYGAERDLAGNYMTLAERRQNAQADWSWLAEIVSESGVMERRIPGEHGDRDKLH